MGDDVGCWLSEYLCEKAEEGFRMYYHKSEASSRPSRDEDRNLCPLLQEKKDAPLYSGQDWSFLTH